MEFTDIGDDVLGVTLFNNGIEFTCVELPKKEVNLFFDKETANQLRDHLTKLLEEIK